jgi:hypothetical protein
MQIPAPLLGSSDMSQHNYLSCNILSFPSVCLGIVLTSSKIHKLYHRTICNEVLKIHSENLRIFINIARIPDLTGSSHHNYRMLVV